MVGYYVLRAIAPRKGGNHSVEVEESPDTKLLQYFGDDFPDLIQGKTVIDFGCGRGKQAVEMALLGAEKVIGIDINTERLKMGERLAQEKGVSGKCFFCESTTEKADIIISKDAFEHFADPLAILNLMAFLLKPDGCVLAAFGPTWLHPYGGHFFSMFPWAHLIFSEESLARWREDYKHDGARGFVGLNKLTIDGFERIVSRSPFHLDWLDTVPIKGLSIFRSRLFREIGSSIVRCKLSLD